MARLDSRWTWVIAAALLSAFFLARWQRAAEAYPYYFAWDMDLVTSVDLLGIHEGALPDHVHHPGFGMYLALSAQQRWSHAQGQLGAFALGDVERSLNPLGVMADHTLQLRRLSPYACLVLTLCLWGALVVALRPPPSVALVVLAFLGLQEGTLYQASFVRSELYAGCYLALALFLCAVWRRLGLHRGRWWLGPLVGLLLGLALLSKVQVVACLALAPLLLFWAPPREGPQPEPPAPSRAALAWGVGTLVAFSALMLLAARHPVQPGSVTYTETYRLGLVGAAVWLGLTGLVVVQLLGRRSARVPQGLLGAVDLSAFVAAGFVASFALHLLLYDDWATGLRYGLLDAKLTFWRGGAAYWGDATAAAQYNHAPGTSVLASLAYQPTSFLGLLAAGGLLTAAWRWNLGRVGRGHVVAFAGLVGVVAVQVALATRPYLRDLLWLDLLLSVPGVWLALHVALASRRRRRVQVAACVALIATLFAGELQRTRSLPARVEALSEIDGWQPWRWLFGWYRVGNHARYRAMLEDRYDVDGAAQGLLAATRVEADVSAARSAFPSLALGVRRAGRLAVGWPAWVDAPGRRIVEVPPALEGALLLDPSGCATRGDVVPRPTALDHYSELAPARPAPGGHLPVRVRSDLNLLLFLRPEDAGRLSAAAAGALVPTPLRVTVGREAPADWQGLLVVAPFDVPLDQVREPWFAVLVEPVRPPFPGRRAVIGELETVWRSAPLSPSQAPAFARILRTSSSRWERLYSAHGLGRVGPHPLAAEALQEALDDPDPAVRLEAARGLAGAGAGRPEAAAALETCGREDPDPRVREAARRSREALLSPR
jgi:hypothetical protein